MERETEVAMLRFSPIRGSHAVQEAVFYVQFAPEIAAEAFKGISARSSKIENILPTKSDIRTLQVVAEPDNSSLTDDVSGVEFSRLSGGGDPEWIMRFSGDGISIHCLDYSRFEHVWGMARTLLLEALSLVPSGTAISGIGMRYIDRFHYNSNAGEYDLTKLFLAQSLYIAPRCFSAGKRWHSHNGWFAEVEGNSKNYDCLNQLNINGSLEMLPSGSTDLVTVDHNLNVRPHELGEFSISHDDFMVLDNIMTELHNDNKRTMSKIFTPAVCRRLNLVVDADADRVGDGGQ